MRLNLLLLCFCCSAALGRDPFQPLEQHVCHPSVEPLASWRLLGILGKAPRLHAWLIDSQGKVIKVHQDSPFPVSPWQLTSLTRRSLTLDAANSCVPLQQSFHIKGRIDDKDNHPAVIDVSDARQGQPIRTAEPGL